MNQLSIALPVKDIKLNIRYSGQQIMAVDFVTDAGVTHPADRFAQQILQQFENYFNRSHSNFSLPCQMSSGSLFQQKVWRALQRVPYGQVKTYGTLARELGSSARAVGNACRNNPFPVIIPCHRVVAASGVGGYAGDTLLRQKGKIDFMQIKQWLLVHEQANTE